MNSGPRITRIRHELKRRRLIVSRLERIAPSMLRVVLGGAELEGFTSLGFDDHVKMFFPSPAAAVTPISPSGAAAAESFGEPSAPAMRDFTPRRYDAVAGELWIDFFLHEAGPATAWAKHAQVGDSIVVAGPKGSALVAADGIDSHVLIGDETALPAIGRRLEELPAGARAVVLVEVDDTDWPTPKSPAEFKLIWVERQPDARAPAADLIRTLRTLAFPPGQCFAWVALESNSARAVRRYLKDERGLKQEWIKAAAYWRRGAVGVHERIEDDA